MNLNLAESGEEKEEEEEEFRGISGIFLTSRKMFSRVMNKVRSPDRSTGTNKSNSRSQQDSEAHHKLNPIEAFYDYLGDGLRSLEGSLSSTTNDPVSFFHIEWLVQGVSFLHSVHTETFALVETVWLPTKSGLGPDSVSDYLEVSMSLLDTCNNLKEALNQLETYQMSMDLILRRFISAASLLDNMDPDVEAWDSSSYLQALAESTRELDRLDATNDSYSTWVELVPKYDLGEKLLKANSLARTNSGYPLPATPVKKRDREVSVALHDVQVVISFVSSIMIWVITGRAGDKQSPVEVKFHLSTRPIVKEKKSSSPWPTFLFRLKDTVGRRVEIIRKTNNNNNKCSMKLQDVNSLHSSLKALRADLESGFREGKFFPGTEFAEKIRNLLDEKRQKLVELTKSLERISTELNEIFTEIIERRKKVLDICESRPLFHAFSI